jgi:6-methylsalicylate decarboxylase
MGILQISTAILSVSTPGAGFLRDAGQRASMARKLNDYAAELVAGAARRFGYFATLPMPDVAASAAEAARALDSGADGVVILASDQGTYLGTADQDELFARLNERGAVVFVHPADLPGPVVDGIAPFAADFLLDTTRAAYLLVRKGIVRRYRRIRFILSQAGGFVPYASHRMAIAIAGELGRSPLDVLDDFRGFYFDTALSSSPAALPTLLAFARPGHVVFGSDWPFAPTAAGQYFATGLDTYDGLDDPGRIAINAGNAAALFPRLGIPPTDGRTGLGVAHLRAAIRRAASRAVFRLVQPR